MQLVYRESWIFVVESLQSAGLVAFGLDMTADF